MVFVITAKQNIIANLVYKMAPVKQVAIIPYDLKNRNTVF